MELKNLIDRCKLGEKEAFRELFQGIEKEALATAYLISGNRGISEDILQETYIKCIREIKNLRNEGAFKTWFFKIMIRTGWDLCNKHSRIVPVDIENQRQVHLHGFQYEDDIANCELKLTVHNAINKLNDKLKAVVILYYFNDMSVEEVAKILGCFKTTVKSRLFYARNQLKEELQHSFSDDYNFKKINGRECDHGV
ncbi:RNA polymerase sigma factor [Clostridium sp. CX1]|uniref:RNA polymerase sigma factor n=1 Tax=Clostridium sp. CX1 TaxID=2978346 RepID=UPI0021C1BD43|nr:RNA polymerase sigma factor [Clostridium sp. CX1]MCT8978817.1 RNA polymerase sigma factor [Clostridium sp. CX1]